MKQAKKKSFKIGNKEFSFSFVLSIASSIVGVAFSFLAARFLESELYGEVQYYVSIISMLSMIMIFGSDNFLIKNLQFSSKEENLVSKIYFFIFALSSFVLPIYFRIGYSLLTKLNGNVVIIFSIFVIALLLSLTTISCTFFQAKNRYEIKILFSSFVPHLLFLVVFLVHFFTHTTDFFVRYYLLYYAVFYGTFGVVIFFKEFRIRNLFLSWDNLVTIMFFGLSWLLFNITTPLTNIIVGERYKLFGLVGIFSISGQIMTIAAIPSGILTEISYTVFAKLTKEKRFDDLYKYYKTFCRLSIYMSVPFYIAFIVGATNIFSLFGSSYLGHNIVLVLFSCSAIIDKITGPCGSILIMGGREKDNLLASVVRFVVFIGLTAGLINFTIYAALYGLLASSLISNVLKLIFLSRFTKKSYFSINVFLTFVVIAVLCFICFVPLLFIKNIYLWLGLNMIIGVGLLIAPIVFSPFKTDKMFFKLGKDAF